jgi:LacI family repressor for deo operon, udp, cdd, tsx, nupC, and nupG
VRPYPQRAADTTVTMKDVALAAGVSTATVSRALRQLSSAAPATRIRVSAIAAAMDYTISPSAAALATGRSRTVAVVTPTVRHWFYSKALEGATRALASRNYSLNIVLTDPNGEDSALGSSYNHVDALITLGNATEQGRAAAQLKGSSLPRVAIGGHVPHGNSVRVDERQLLAAAARHLRQMGHERTALLIGDSYKWIDKGVSCPEILETPRETLSRSADEPRLLEIFDKLWARWAPGPVAFICTSDEACVGIILECARRGLRIPEQVAIVSLEGSDLAATVGITSILQHPSDQGALAVQLLLDELDEVGGTPASVIAPFDLVIRSSSTPLMAAAI